ncbi:MAG: lipoprotein insertase outer membrane protein LolB [Pseudomonadota bacterium]|nr:lipoprotein insertase outer membrane protein LolB [Pseudomonadota bacterium]
MTMTFLRLLPLAAATLLLSACASLTPDAGRAALQDNLSDLTHWQVRGKLSVVSPDDSATGYLTWNQDNDDYDLFIAGPFGAGASRLSGSSRQAELTLPGWDKPQRAASAEQLMLQYMGWNFPVSDIRYWVKGQATPGNGASAEFDQYGLLQSLQQHGWTVSYSRYQQQDGYWLPGLIKIRGHDFRFTFSIKEWTAR